MSPLEERIQAQCVTVTVWLLILLCLLLVSLSSCTDEGTWNYRKDGTYGPVRWHSEERIEPEYECPDDSDPESLKPFYDPGLTEALNR